MNVETFYPRDERLKKCIAYYYFLKSDSADFVSEYYAFPNTLHALNIHRSAICQIKSDLVTVDAVEQHSSIMLLQGRFEIPLHARLTGRIDKVTIIFKPLGLNHFIKSSFNDVAGEATQFFTEWEKHSKHNGFLSNFFVESDNSKRIDILEEYLLQHFHLAEDAQVLEPCINLLSNFNEQIPIEEILRRTNIKPRTFNRLFKTHMGISPAGFRKIARFRHSLNNKIFNRQFKRLTDIGYESNFYDQSYFIKMYNKLTNTAPSQFFKSIDRLADSHLIFKFVSR